jgi:hypothetical protein
VWKLLKNVGTWDCKSKTFEIHFILPDGIGGKGMK